MSEQESVRGEREKERKNKMSEEAYPLITPRRHSSIIVHPHDLIFNPCYLILKGPITNHTRLVD